MSHQTKRGKKSPTFFRGFLLFGPLKESKSSQNENFAAVGRMGLVFFFNFFPLIPSILSTAISFPISTIIPFQGPTFQRGGLTFYYVINHTLSQKKIILKFTMFLYRQL